MTVIRGSLRYSCYYWVHYVHCTLFWPRNCYYLFMVCFDLFQQSFKEMVAMCLVKDQTKRPTAEKLLKHSFFKSAKPPEHIVKKLFADLPPLWKRVKDLQVYPVNHQYLGVNFYRVTVDIVVNWM